MHAGRIDVSNANMQPPSSATSKHPHKFPYCKVVPFSKNVRQVGIRNANHILRKTWLSHLMRVGMVFRFPMLKAVIRVCNVITQHHDVKIKGGNTNLSKGQVTFAVSWCFWICAKNTPQKNDLWNFVKNQYALLNFVSVFTNVSDTNSYNHDYKLIRSTYDES